MINDTRTKKRHYSLTVWGYYDKILKEYDYQHSPATNSHNFFDSNKIAIF